MNDKVKLGVASGIRNLLQTHQIVSWRYEVTHVSDLVLQVKVWPVEGQPPRYFTVQISEAL